MECGGSIQLIYIALLRAMAEKRIPGIPHATRIGLLQQTDIQVEDDEDLEIGNRGVDGTTQGSSQKRDKTVLEQVMSSDRVRNELVRDINGERHHPDDRCHGNFVVVSDRHSLG